MGTELLSVMTEMEMGEVLHIRQDMPSKLLSINQNIARFFIEINLLNKKNSYSTVHTIPREHK